MQDDSRAVIVRRQGEGETVYLGGFPHTTMLAGRETDGTVCVVECQAERDGATPWHLHHRDDETFYVLDGEMTFYTRESATTAGAGTVVHLPRGVAHAFVVESERARFLVIGTPGVQDAFFRAAGSEVPGPPDFERMGRAAQEHGVELLGPPPSSGGAGAPAPQLADA